MSPPHSIFLLREVRLPLLALCSLVCGGRGPGPLRARTAVGAKLEAAATPCTKRLAAVLASSLPLDLSLEVHSGLGAGKLLQDIVRNCLDKSEAGEDAGAMVTALRVFLHLVSPALSHYSSPITMWNLWTVCMSCRTK